MFKRLFIVSIVFFTAICFFGIARDKNTLSSAEGENGKTQLQVKFKRYVTLKDALKVMEEYQLDVDSRNTGRRWRRRPHLIVIVPTEKTEEWIDKLELEANIENVQQYSGGEEKPDIAPEGEQE